MLYNQWYTDTYESILQIADWSNFSADVAIKMIVIFSWMPQTIMAIKHSDTEFKWKKYKIGKVRNILETYKKSFNNVKRLSLINSNVKWEKHESDIKTIFKHLSKIMGPVAASKYLHFSAPRFFPMWDNKIRKSRSLKNDASDYLQYMKLIQNDLSKQKNRKKASKKYHANLIRGWDICCMENR